MQLDLLLANLLSPPVLFFALGMLATALRSDLTIPEPLPKLFSLYLLWAIGFKGGYELQHAGLTGDVLLPIAAAMALSLVTPIVLFPVLRRLFNGADACALAACF
ncbi:MAG: sodium-dependent bicarbonate transport family permease, partial [Planctomycetota bacterium]